MGDNYYVLTPISYYFFANTILKCAAFPFLTPARKPPQIFIYYSSRIHCLAISMSICSAEAICSTGNPRFAKGNSIFFLASIFTF